MKFLNKILKGDCLRSLKRLPENSIDLIVTDPPYQLDSIKKRWSDPGKTKLDFEKSAHHRVARGFMGRTWDVLPQTEVWEECLRVLKPGAFAFIMCTPRQDSLLEAMSRIKDAGFIMGFSPIFWAYACVSEDTEILTDDGFKRWNEIEIGESVATMNIDDEELEYQPILQKYVYDYTGDMIHIKNTNTDQLLTPNHRVLFKRRTSSIRSYGEWEYDESSNITYGRSSSCYLKLPLACRYNGKLSIGKDLSELLGWIISDGHFYNGARNAKDIRIYQSDGGGNYVNRIRNLLNRVGIPFGEHTRERKYSDISIKGVKIKKKGMYRETCFYFSGEWCKRIRRLLPDKKPTKKLLNLIPEEMESLFIGLILGDGSRNPSGTSCAFYQKDEWTRDFMQILSLHLGYRSSTNESKWMINVCYRNSTEIQNPKKIKIVEYSGKVWCVQTENSNFVARRNGKIFITGNSGLPKAHNTAKAIDRRAGHIPDEIPTEEMPKSTEVGQISKNRRCKVCNRPLVSGNPCRCDRTYKPQTDEARALQGSYGGGGGLKPAVEVVIVAMKPLSESTYVDQALKNRKGILWLDDVRIPVGTEDQDMVLKTTERKKREGEFWERDSRFKNEDNILAGVRPEGRFPANLLTSDDPFNEFQDKGTPPHPLRGSVDKYEGWGSITKRNGEVVNYGDAGSFSRYFSLDAWWDNMCQFFVVTKPSRWEKNIGLPEKDHKNLRPEGVAYNEEEPDGFKDAIRKGNYHPTVKPIKLMANLIMMGSREGDVVLDPFLGSGTTAIASLMLKRNFVGMEIDPEYCISSQKRIGYYLEHKCDARFREIKDEVIGEQTLNEFV